MDALLSAAGLRDIGHYFPDTDKKYKGADSRELFKKVMELARGEGYAPVNLSVTVQAEKPRLAPYSDEMNASLAAAGKQSPQVRAASAFIASTGKLLCEGNSS